MSAAAINDRRMRAMEAAQDAAPGNGAVVDAAQAAIETATRVRITDDVIAAYDALANRVPGTLRGTRQALAAAFQAAGFEVEE